MSDDFRGAVMFLCHATEVTGTVKTRSYKELRVLPATRIRLDRRIIRDTSALTIFVVSFTAELYVRFSDPETGLRAPPTLFLFLFLFLSVLRLFDFTTDRRQTLQCIHICDNFYHNRTVTDFPLKS